MFGPLLLTRRMWCFSWLVWLRLCSLSELWAPRLRSQFIYSKMERLPAVDSLLAFRCFSSHYGMSLVNKQSQMTAARVAQRLPQKESRGGSGECARVYECVFDLWLLVWLCPDCATGSHHGADCVPCAQHLRVPHPGVQAASLLHHRAWRARQQNQWLLSALGRSFQRDELAEEAARYSRGDWYHKHRSLCVFFLNFLPSFALRVYMLSAYIAPGCSGKAHLHLATYSIMQFVLLIILQATSYSCHLSDVYRAKWHFAVKHRNQTVIHRHIVVSTAQVANDKANLSQITQQQLTRALMFKVQHSKPVLLVSLNHNKVPVM